ncbi:MAG TPA: sigma-54 dependent transcriptional regulator [Xanthobacteraceae bacterium]|jgi:DNA-binding NtrC family response regulator
MAILIVGDDPVQCRLLEGMLHRFNYETVRLDNGDAALARLSATDGGQIDCIILDLVMPNLDGLGFLAKLRQAAINVPVIVEATRGGIDSVVAAVHAGAIDFVVKPVTAERLWVSLRNALNASALESELARIKHSRAGTVGFADILTTSSCMQGVLRMVAKAAAADIPVLIVGESGVGKELLARAIHGSGERRAKPFIAVNCEAVPEKLVESFLFGHEKGPFAGATEGHPGKFVEASGGTLFLGAVGELPPAAQTKLLCAIADGEVKPVGAHKSMKVDVRLVCATDRNLVADVKRGRFREDLFYRLHVFPISVPPLRERPADIPALARHFLARFAAEEGKCIRLITPEALRLLTAFRWPGNVRQLENAIFRAVVLAESDSLGHSEFPQIAAQMVHDFTSTAPRGKLPPAAASALPDVELAAFGEHLSAGGAATHPLAPIDALPLLDPNGEVRPLSEVEADLIRYAVTHYRGQMSVVARRLRIGRSTLYRKLDALGLNAERTQAHRESVSAERQPRKIA